MKYTRVAMEKLTVCLPSKTDLECLESEWTPDHNNPHFEEYSSHSTPMSTSCHDNEMTNTCGHSVLHEMESCNSNNSHSNSIRGTSNNDIKASSSVPVQLGVTDSVGSGPMPASSPRSCSDKQCPDIDEGGQDMFECGICTEDLLIPKSLPCLHNFCLDCLQKYFKVNNLKEADKFLCPNCRASVTIPPGGPSNFPTNFHIENLRKRCRELDLGLTIKEAVCYLECRAEEIVDELMESKRQVLKTIGQQRGRLIDQIEDIVESLQEAVEDQYTIDSNKSVAIINSIKVKLTELQGQLGSTQNLSTDTQTDSNPHPIRLNALTKLRRQAEIISKVNQELEGLKEQADRELSQILEYQLVFCPAAADREQLKRHMGRLLMVKEGQSLETVSVLEREEGFCPLNVRSWSQSWWVLIFAVLPAVICAMLVKLLMTLFEKLLD